MLEDPDLAEMHRRLRVASLRAALRQEPPGNVKRREQMIRELAQVDPHWRKWHGKEMTTIEAREREAQRRREAREARAKARQASAPRAPAPAADLATRNQQKLDEYAMLLGRGMACGLDTRREGKLVAAWIDRAFPLMTKSRFLEGFAATMEHHAQQQAQGKSTASCKSVQQTLAAMSDEDWSGPP